MIRADDLRFMLHDMLNLYGVPATLVRSIGGDPWGNDPTGETTRAVRVILSSYDEGAWRDKLIAEVAAEGLDPAPVAGDKLRLEGEDWPVKVVWPQHAPGGGTPLSYRLELER